MSDLNGLRASLGSGNNQIVPACFVKITWVILESLMCQMKIDSNIFYF